MSAGNPALDVLEEAIQGALSDDLDVFVPDCTKVAESVIAAIRSMTPEQRAEVVEP